MGNDTEHDPDYNALDSKITKLHYPRTNNDNILEFVFEKDPKLFLRKNKIAIRGAIQIPTNYVVDTNYASKLFSQMTVSVDAQAISSNRVK